MEKSDDSTVWWTEAVPKLSNCVGMRRKKTEDWLVCTWVHFERGRRGKRRLGVPHLLVMNVFVSLFKKPWNVKCTPLDIVLYLEFVLKLFGECQHISVESTTAENYRVTPVTDALNGWSRESITEETLLPKSLQLIGFGKFPRMNVETFAQTRVWGDDCKVISCNC